MKMNLWVRSQDKEVLTRVVDIWKDTDKNEIWSKSSFATKNCLGRYKTKERTIEVLDEIQNFMRNSVYVKKTNRLGEEIDLIPKPILIYNMPKD